MTDDEKIDFLKRNNGKKCYMWDNEKPNKSNRCLNGIILNGDYTFIDEKETHWRHCEVEEEPTYIPYCYDDDIIGLKIKPIGLNGLFGKRLITGQESTNIFVGGLNMSYETLFEMYTHLDGSPCGVKI